MKEDLFAYLYEAVRSERGIAIKDDNPLVLRHKLYGARRDDPTFEGLNFIISPDGNELWITKDVKWQGKKNAP